MQWVEYLVAQQLRLDVVETRRLVWTNLNAIVRQTGILGLLPEQLAAIVTELNRSAGPAQLRRWRRSMALGRYLARLVSKEDSSRVAGLRRFRGDGMTHRMLNTFMDTAQKMLERDPGPVVRYRLLRDVLRLSADAADLQAAQQNLEHSRCIRALAAEQWPDGSWGAFHSRDTQVRQRIPTTEVGVDRALALGLDASHPVLAKASEYLLRVMRGDIAFPDRPERNDRWQVGVRLFVSSTLSLVHPDHPALDADRALWYEIARRTFRSGQYSAADEIAAHAELTGATVKDSYLVLSGKYQLNLLGSVRGTLPQALETALLRWLWERPQGIGYLAVALNREPPCAGGQLDRWLASLELLARLSPSWVCLAKPAIGWLWEQRYAHGLWDFGARSSSTASLPLSDSWRGAQNRALDWTTRILVLLRRYCDDVLLSP